jgi:Na+-driven multidrug efflux pump
MMLAELVVGVIATLCFELFPLQLMGLFGSTEDQLYAEFGVLTFRIYLSSMIFCCIQKAAAVFLQSIGKPAFAMILSLARDFIFMTILLIVLPIFMGVTGPLLAAPIADTLCLILTVVFMTIVFKTTLSSPSEENEDKQE